MIDGLTAQRVGGMAILLITVLDTVQQGCFLYGVGNAEVGCAFEHEMFEVMGEAGGLGGIILTTHFDSDVSLQTVSPY